jgi:MscS family membrane protein
MQQYWSLLMAVIDGLYGWLSELGAVLLIVFLFNFCAKAVLQKLHARFKKLDQPYKECFVHALYKPLSYYVWFFAGAQVFGLLYSSIKSERTGNLHLALSIGAIFALMWFFLRWKKGIIQRLQTKSKASESSFDPSKLDVMDKLSTVLIIFTAVMMILEVSERSFNTLIAFGGVGGLALAIASQEIIANFFAGLMIYLNHPFVIGDWIHLPEKNVEGIVEEIGWYQTRIRSLDKKPIYVPNSVFSKVILLTPSRMTHRQIKEIIGLRYADHKVLGQVLREIRNMLGSHPNIDRNQSIIVRLEGFGSYSLNVIVSAYSSVLDKEGYARIKEEVLFNIMEIVIGNGAEFASPTTRVEINAPQAI